MYRFGTPTMHMSFFSKLNNPSDIEDKLLEYCDTSRWYESKLFESTDSTVVPLTKPQVLAEFSNPTAEFIGSSYFGFMMQ